MNSKDPDSLEDFEQFEFEHGGKRRPVYRKGRGPGVLVMHEIPGITPEVAGFARRLANEGFTVFMPVMFGTPGKPVSTGYILGQIASCCVSSEFNALAKHRSSPIADWLRALGRKLHQECGGPGVGALGMCFTGGFALSLMMEPAFLAPVLSQPSLPFAIGAERRRAIGISPEELQNLKERTSEGACVLGLRFSEDPAVPPERFDTLQRELGKGFDPIVIDSSPGNAFGISQKAHSVLTKDFVDQAGHPTREAYDRVIAFFNERLRGV